MSVIRRNATRPKSSLTVAATNIGDGHKALNPFNVRLVNVRLNGRLLHSPRTRQWRRPSPGGAAQYSHEASAIGVSAVLEGYHVAVTVTD